jgi:hypothetical protein
VAVRDLTWNEHANLLNNVYPKIIAENSFQNFEMFYVPPDFSMIIGLLPPHVRFNAVINPLCVNRQVDFDGRSRS